MISLERMLQIFNRYESIYIGKTPGYKPGVLRCLYEKILIKRIFEFNSAQYKRFVPIFRICTCSLQKSCDSMLPCLSNYLNSQSPAVRENPLNNMQKPHIIITKYANKDLRDENNYVVI